MDVAKYWIEAGADGWRLDVPNEINDDAFWARFRQVVKGANPDAYILGEIWTVDPRWVDDKHFDGLMHYPVREALLDALNGQITPTQFGDKVEGLFDAYPAENIQSMYVPLGSHDTKRLHHKVGGDLQKAKLAFLYQFAYPGAPAIYYGDEIGLDGDKDPDCRRAFPWNKNDWQGDLRIWVQGLIALRKSLPALRRGKYQRLYADEKSYVFMRSLGAEKILIALNFSAEKLTLRIPVGDFWDDGHEVRNFFTYQQAGVQKGHLEITLNPWYGAWMK